MKENFEAFAALVKKWEGGYVDDPDDPGGATMWGIAWNMVGRALGLRDKSELRNLTWDQAKTWFREHYWNACHCDALPAGIDLFVGDAAVNQGPGAAGRFLQCALNDALGCRLTVDGEIGPQTLAQVRAAAGCLDTVFINLVARRALHYTGLTKFWKYGYGWLRRLADACRLGAQLASAEGSQLQ